MPSSTPPKSNASLHDDTNNSIPSDASLVERATAFYHTYLTRETMDNCKIPVAVLMVALVATGKSHILLWHFLYPLYWIILRVIAVAVGVALGLGFATHVYDQLDRWSRQNNAALMAQQDAALALGGVIAGSRKQETQALLMEHLRGSSTTGPATAAEALTGKHFTKVAPSVGGVHTAHSMMIHDSGYAALMASAGYDIDPDYKRGQVVKAAKPMRQYPFTDVPLDQQYALQVMLEEWPSLPRPIVRELGRFLEFLMRDYVSTWYSMIDGGMPYPQIVQNAKDKAEAEERGEVYEEPPPKPPLVHPFPRWMVFHTASCRPLPLMENMYRSVSIVFGNLAHRVEDVNIFRLVLLKWVKVIAHTFKVYRQLRKALLEKQAVHHSTSTGNISNNNTNTNTGNLHATSNTANLNASSSNLNASVMGGIGILEEARGSVGRVVRRTVDAVKSSTTGAAPNIGELIEHTNTNEASASEATEEPATIAEPASSSEPKKSTFQPVSEMAITREFLFTGKLHPAVTFGLEIPSLLFSDPSGHDCGTGVEGDDPENYSKDSNNNKDKKKQLTQDEILEQRLFHTSILEECELDYNRVLASRIVKLLIPRQDYGSPILASLLTEIMAGGVLTPTMSCFCPDYLNYFIKVGMDLATAEEQEAGGAAEEEGAPGTIQRTASSGGASNASTPLNADGQPILRTWGEEEDPNEGGTDGNNDNGVVGVVAATAGFSTEDGDMVLDDIYGHHHHQAAPEEMGDLMDLSSREVNFSELNKEAAEDLLGTSSDARSDDGAGGDGNDSAGDIEEDDDEMEDDIIMEETTNAAGVYPMITLISEALMNLQRQLDLEDCRRNSQGGSGVEVDWDNPSCKKDVVRLVLVVEALILHGRRKNPIQIAARRGDEEEGEEGGEKEGGGGSCSDSMRLEDEFNAANFTQIMMDLTSDIEAFEKRHVLPEDTSLDAAAASDDDASEEDESPEDYDPTPSDLSTLRTLISAWLHTGQIYRTVCTLVKARTTVLRPFYHSRAFLRNPQTSAAFTRQLRALDGVDVMVDTVAILNSPRIDPAEEAQTSLEKKEEVQSEPTSALAIAEAESKAQSEKEDTPTRKKTGFKSFLDKGMQNLNDKKKAIGDKVNLKGSLKGLNPASVRSLSSEHPPPNAGEAARQQPQSNRELSSSVLTSSVASSTAPASFSQVQALPGGTPRYLDYHRNEAFASSLRSERERRMQSWITSIQNDTEMIQVVCRIKGATAEDVAFHRELHHVARIFYAGTNLIGIRDAARSSATKQRKRLNTADSTQSSASGSDTHSPEVSLLTVEMACSRRRIEVPDDDSSFLLRAQPRALSSMGVHRDTRNADKSYRGFAASFEEPAVLPGTNTYKGGRYVRRCQLRYYPSNRMASVVMLNDTRKLDQRKGKSIMHENTRGKQTNSSVPFLTPDFMKERHICQKWIPRGSTSRSQPGIMSSNVMEQADFTAAPRTGKALDFVYRMSLFESPMIDLGGKRFTVHDAASHGAHRADASALEMSDAALSAALLVIGRDYYIDTGKQQNDEGSVVSSGATRNKVELGPDGYPIIWMKYSRKLQDGTTSTEIKPYRTSFIRAAMLLTSTRQEAQLQVLVKCVKAGSAKSATKARTDAQLRPTLRLLDFARDRSREKQEKLLRDLKLGMNHIDREQLRRNALLSPRYPTVIRSIQVSIEKALPAKDANVKIPGNPQSTVFKIRCVAIVDLVSDDMPDEVLAPYLTEGGKPAVTYKETWVVYRPFRDFQALHKHLKSQVAASESSGTAGSRLVGAAAAAFTAGNAVHGGRNRQRNALIPSLGQATKAGALGVTQRSVTKRMEVLDGYLHHVLSSGNQLSRSPEVLMFIGAFYPLSQDVLVGKLPISPLADPLGRAEMAREALKFAPPPSASGPTSATSEHSETGMKDDSYRDGAGLETRGAGSKALATEPTEEATKPEKVAMTIPAIVNKIDKVPLGQVRNRIFELLSYQFGFENASFFRSRMLSAIKTMSFAVTTPGDFRKTLYKTHIEQVSAEALAYWINYGTELLWPDGVFYISSPALTPEEQKQGADLCKELLHTNFPEQLRTVLGGDLTRDGLDMLHEMLQNRLVMKSMFYMLFDLLWEEIFPEMKDVLSCGEALDIDFEEEE